MIEELRRKIIKCCYWYYVKSDPIMTDYDFDMLFKKLEQAENTLIDPPPENSPTQMIYGDSPNQYPDWAKNRNLTLLSE